jgi:hypothetical protein
MNIRENLMKKYIREKVIIEKLLLKLRRITEKMTEEEYRECRKKVSYIMCEWTHKGEKD